MEQRIKKNTALIENKSSYAVERPKDVVDRLLSIDHEIEEMMKKAQEFG